MSSFGHRRRDKGDRPDRDLTRRLLEDSGSSSRPPSAESRTSNCPLVTLHDHGNSSDHVPALEHDDRDGSALPSANDPSLHDPNGFHGLHYTGGHQHPVSFTHSPGGGGIGQGVFYEIPQSASISPSSQAEFPNNVAPVLNIKHPQPPPFGDSRLESPYMDHQGGQFPASAMYAQDIPGHSQFVVPPSEAPIPSHSHSSSFCISQPVNVSSPQFTSVTHPRQLSNSRPSPWLVKMKSNKFRIHVRRADGTVTDFLAKVDFGLPRSQISRKAAQFTDCVRPLPKRKRNEGHEYASLPVIATEFGSVEVELNIVVKDDLGDDFIQLRLALPGLMKLKLLKNEGWLIDAFKSQQLSQEAGTCTRNNGSDQSGPSASRPSPSAPRPATRLRTDGPPTPLHISYNLALRNSHSPYPQPQPRPGLPNNNSGAALMSNHASIAPQFNPTMNDAPGQGPVPWPTMQHNNLPPDGNMGHHHLPPSSSTPATDEVSQPNQLHDPEGSYSQYRP